MKRKSLRNDPCPIARALDVVGDWWTLLVLREIVRGNGRFSGIQEKTGAARNVLALRLKKLVAERVLRKTPAPDGTAFEEYVLTEKGRELAMVLVALRIWGTRWLFGRGSQPRAAVDAASGESVRLELRTESGRALRPAAAIIVGRAR